MLFEYPSIAILASKRGAGRRLRDDFCELDAVSLVRCEHLPKRPQIPPLGRPIRNRKDDLRKFSGVSLERDAEVAGGPRWIMMEGTTAPGP